MKKILVVDDEKPISDIIKFNMVKEGYEVVTAFDGREALEMFEAENPDILILDLMLPELDGLEVARTIRKTSNVPIIVLSAKDSEFDKVIGLEIGADDYVTKPFSNRELQARVKAILRRSEFAVDTQENEKGSNELAVGELQILPDAFVAKKHGEELELTHREFELLYHLASHVGQVMTREHLLETVWGYDYFGDVRTVDVTIRRLREKIEDTPSRPEFILVVALLFLENRRDNRQLRLLNQKIKDLIAGDYSEVLDMQGSPEITDMTNSINDLSEVTRLTQENLEQETKRLTSILSYMTDGVLATNRRGQIIMINDMASKQLGVDPEEVQNTSILDLLDIADEYDLRDLITKMPELTIDSQDENGEFLSLRVRFALVRRESGFISGLVAVLHDTTEQETEERERRLFVSNVSHELRTPLTSVKSYLEALDEGALSEPVAPEFVKVSLTETNRMMRMVSDLLSLSRIDNDSSHLDVELTNFTAFITFILNRFDKIKSQDETKKYEIVRDYPITPVWVEIDTDKMTQVIDNIMNNAIKYSPDGGKITVGMKTTEDQLIISISDEGLGIPKKDLPKIFDRFYRVDKARSRAQGGTGLGLAIAKEIIKQHHGFIWAKSEYEVGSTFTIVLPYDKDAVLDDDWENEEVESKDD